MTERGPADDVDGRARRARRAAWVKVAPKGEKPRRSAVAGLIFRVLLDGEGLWEGGLLVDGKSWDSSGGEGPSGLATSASRRRHE